MTSVYIKATNLPVETVGGDLLIVDAEKDTFFSSNEMGSLIWAALDEPVSANQITDKILETTDGAEKPTVLSDVEEFLHDLVENGLVKKVSGD